MADTDILLSVDLDVADAEKTAEQLHKEIENVFSSNNGKQSAAMISLESSMKKNILKAKELREAMAKISEQRIATQDYKDIQASLDAALNERYKELNKAQAMENAGVDKTSDEYRKQADIVADLTNRVKELRKARDAMVKGGTAFIGGAETAEYAEKQRQLDIINDKLKQQLVRQKEIQAASMKMGKQTTKQIVKPFANVGSVLKKGIRTLGLWTLGISGIVSLVRKLHSIIKAGFNSFLNSTAGKGLKKEIDDLKDSLANVRNQFAVAFEPIIQMVIPYLKQLADWLTIVIDKFAQFIAAISGQQTYIKSIKKAGMAAKEAGASASKSLASFDKLNNITTGGGGGAGSYETAMVNPEMLTKLNKVKETIKSIAKVVSDNFKKGFNLTFNSDRAKKNLETMKEDILAVRDEFGRIFSDPKVRAAASHFLASWSQRIGEISGAVLDAAITIASDITRILLEPIINCEDEIKETIATILESTAEAIDRINDAFAELWQNIQASYDEHIKPVVDTVIEMLTDAYSWLLRIFSEIYTYVVDKISDIQVTIMEEMGPTIEQIFGFIHAVADLIKWLWDNILMPVMEWIKQSIWPIIKKILDIIASYVKSRISIISNVIQILFNFLKTIINAIVDLLTGKPQQALERFKGFFSDAFSNIKNIVQSFWNYIKDFGAGISGIFEGIGNALSGAWTGIKDFAGKFKTNSKTSIPGYASGQVIPPTMSPHLAVLGDNNRETEVVSPLSTIRQAVSEAMQNMGGSQSGQTIILNLDGREFMRVLVDRNNEYKKQNGGVSAFS